MSALGGRARFTTPTGATVSALCVDERASLPVFDVEVVQDGEVIDYYPHVHGHTALMALAERKRWTPV